MASLAPRALPLIFEGFPFSSIAGVAQLIERRLAKAKVAGLNPVSRSNLITEITEKNELGGIPAFRKYPKSVSPMCHGL